MLATTKLTESDVLQQLQRTQARIDAVKQNLVRADEQALQLAIELEDDADATQALRVLQGLQEFMNKQ
jgi:uncharacterized membrane protein